MMAHLSDAFVALPGGQFRIDRNAQHLAGESLGYRAVLDRMCREVPEALLLMEGHRVIDFAADAAGREVALEHIAPARAGDPQGELIPYVAHLRVGPWDHDPL